jgi:3-isopropylmalate dehydrogenase
VSLKIGVLEGDGIGPEIVPSAVRVFSATGIDVEFVELPVGWTAYEEHGSTVPDQTLNRLKTVDGWLLGPTAAGDYPEDDPAGGNPSRFVRTAFDLYANRRPIRSYDGVGPAGMDVTIVRQNTEGFYADRNMHLGDGRLMPTKDVAVSVRVVTRRESRRIAEVAFACAVERGSAVTAVHKSNVLKRGDGLFLEAVESVGESYPNVKLETQLVDSFATGLVADPTQYDVVLAPNLYGDILSDEAAGVVGNLGLAPGLNHNDDDGYAMGQPTHGTAPDIAGRGIANPASAILSGALLLEWLDRRRPHEAARATVTIRDAITRTINGGTRTPDVGGDATTREFTDEVVDRVRG